MGEEVGVGGHGEAVEVGARQRVALPSHDGSVLPQSQTDLNEKPPQQDLVESVWIPVLV